MKHALLMLVAAALPPAGAMAQQAAPAVAAAPPSPLVQPKIATAFRGPAAPPVVFNSRHAITIRGQRVAFTANAGEIFLHDDVGNPTASVFSFTFLRDPVPGARPRPVVFVMGGGPGSSSSFLNVGLLGPWTVPMDRVDPNGPRRSSALPPYDLADNAHSLLDVADLVFVDPVGTGYSRALGEARNPDFWGVDADNEANAAFIGAWLSKYGRWNSPKFFLGESYGSIRASIVSDAFMGGPYGNGVLRGGAFDGVMLLATVLSLGDLRGDAALTQALALPAQADTAWYHARIDRRDRTLAAFDAEVRGFAEGAYLAALRKEKAGTLAADDRAATVARLTGYTGLPADAFAKSLTVPADAFARTVLADRGQVVGMYDSRFAFVAGKGGDPIGDDPALGRLFAIWTGAMEDMMRTRLGVRMDRPYHQIMWRNLLTGWSFERRGVPPTRNYADDLANVLRRTPEMRAFVSTGYYDFVTPSATARYALRDAGVPAEQVDFHAYEGGHDVYAGEAGYRLADDLHAFVTKAVGTR